MEPAIDRIIQYTLTDVDAKSVNKRRDDAQTYFAAQQYSGMIVHHGADVLPAQTFPAIITRTFEDEPDEVNAQVFLDGNDVLWVTGVRLALGAAPGCWNWPVIA